MNPSVITAIKARLAANWSSTTVQWANDAPNRPDPPAPFVFAEIRGLNSEILSIGRAGSHQLRDDALLSLTVFVPFGTGTDTAYTYAEALAAIFRGVNIAGGIQFLAPTPADAGPGADDGDWFRVTQHIPFFYLYIG